MIRSLMRPVFALTLGVLTVQPLAAQSLSETQVGAIRRWYHSARRSAPGKWGIAIADQQGRILWDSHADEPLIPASTVKLFTTGYARTVLGSDARRLTRVLGEGAVEPLTGRWIGHWALELNGDPSLESPEGFGPRLVDLAWQLQARGIRKLNGPLEVRSANGPAEASYPEGWSRRHWGRLFAPLVGPLTLHENTVSFRVEPGARPGARPVLTDDQPSGAGALVVVHATTVSGRRVRLRIRSMANGGWLLTGTIGIHSRGKGFAAVATNPRAVLARAWASALRQAGIEWTVTPDPASDDSLEQVLAEVQSPVFDSVASDVNRRSLNLGAELLLQWAAGRTDGPEKLMHHVEEVTGLSEIHLVDGSGLSAEDRATPRTFVTYLARFPTTEAGRNFPMLLPANGDGTLRRLNSGFPGQGVVRAKTGTLGTVSTVSGYLGRQDGVLIVSLMYNGSRPYAARQLQWKLFRLLGADGVIIARDSLNPDSTQYGGEDETVE